MHDHRNRHNNEILRVPHNSHGCGSRDTRPLKTLVQQWHPGDQQPPTSTIKSTVAYQRRWHQMSRSFLGFILWIRTFAFHVRLGTTSGCSCDTNDPWFPKQTDKWPQSIQSTFFSESCVDQRPTQLRSLIKQITMGYGLHRCNMLYPLVIHDPFSWFTYMKDGDFPELCYFTKG